VVVDKGAAWPRLDVRGRGRVSRGPVPSGNLGFLTPRVGAGPSYRGWSCPFSCAPFLHASVTVPCEECHRADRGGGAVWRWPAARRQAFGRGTALAAELTKPQRWGNTVSPDAAWEGRGRLRPVVWWSTLRRAWHGQSWGGDRLRCRTNRGGRSEGRPDLVIGSIGTRALRWPSSGWKRTGFRRTGRGA